MLARRFITALLLIVVVAAPGAAADRTVTLLFTNDVESAYDPIPAFWLDDLEMIGGVADAILTINVIAYGVEEKTVESVLEEAFIRYFDGSCSREPGGEGRAQ